MCHSGNQYLQKLGQGHHLVYSPKIFWSCIKISCKKYFCFWIDRFNGEFIFAFFAISFENIFSIFIVREPDYNGSWRVFTPDMMCSLDLMEASSVLRCLSMQFRPLVSDCPQDSSLLSSTHKTVVTSGLHF